jgi:hypothetical protein
MRKYLLLAAMGLAACGSDKTTPGGLNPVENQPPTTDNKADPKEEPLIDPSNPDAFKGPTTAFMGRMKKTTTGTELGWSGSRITARVSGTNSITIGLKKANPYGTANVVRFSVSIDGATQSELITLDQTNPIQNPNAPFIGTFTTTFPDTNTHMVQWTKVTEGSFGDAVFTSIEAGPGGTLLPTPTPSTRHIEFIGDSITNGYGVLGEMTDGGTACNGNSYNSNSDLSFSTLTAKALKADYTLIAYSGEGLVLNNAGNSNKAVPTMFGATLPPASGATDVALADWDFSIKANAVVVNLGTNDFAWAKSGKTVCTVPSCNPDATSWPAAYQAFLSNIRKSYPDAYIIATSGPMLSDNSPKDGQQKTTATAYIQEAVNALTTAGDAKVSFLDLGVQDTSAALGCDYHPSKATHQKMADTLSAHIKAQAGWN